jgi:hypothetical protein
MNLLSFDLSSFDLKPIEQLLFLRIGNYIELGFSASIFDLCSVCNCTKPTIYSSLSRLSSLGLISIVRSPGQINTYSLLIGLNSLDEPNGSFERFNSLDEPNGSFEPFDPLDDVFEPSELGSATISRIKARTTLPVGCSKLSKNRAKRKAKKRK